MSRVRFSKMLPLAMCVLAMTVAQGAAAAEENGATAGEATVKIGSPISPAKRSASPWEGVKLTFDGLDQKSKGCRVIFTAGEETTMFLLLPDDAPKTVHFKRGDYTLALKSLSKLGGSCEVTVNRPVG